MASNLVLLPYAYFSDPSRSRALSGGQIFIGEVNKDPETFPIDVFYIEEDGTEVPAAQPLTIGPGGMIVYNGKVVQIGVNDNYSMRVRDKYNAQVYNVPNNFATGGATKEFVIDTVNELKEDADLHDTLAGAKSRTDLVDNPDNPMRIWIYEKEAFFTVVSGLTPNEEDIIGAANGLQLRADSEFYSVSGLTVASALLYDAVDGQEIKTSFYNTKVEQTWVVKTTPLSSDFALLMSNGKYLALEPKDVMNISNFGAYLDASEDGTSGTDDADAWKNALDFVSNNPDTSYELVFNRPSLLPASRMSGAGAVYPFERGLALPSNLTLTFLNKAAWVLEPNLQYPHVCVPSSDASDITINNARIVGNNAFANGMVVAGIGGTTGNNNINYNLPTVIGIRSEIFVSSNAVFQKEGGAAYVSELDCENARLVNPSAIDCTFHSRISPSHEIYSEIFITDMYAKNCESILNTTPSNFDNRQYALTAPYERITKSKLIITGVEFQDCGASTDARTQLSFEWLDTSGEDGGRASGNYYPWAGIRRGSPTDTYRGLNWQPEVFNALYAEWSPGTTYNAGDKVKVTNDESLGGLFCFGRSGGVSISKVRGRNEHFSGAYPTIGAIFRGIIQNVHLSDIAVDVACKSIYHFGSTPSTSFDLQPFMLSRFVTSDDVFNFGPTQRLADADMPYNGTWATSFNSTVTVDYEFGQESISVHGCGRGVVSEIVSQSLSVTAPSQVTNLDPGTRVRYRDNDSGVIRDGQFSDFAPSSFLGDIAANGERKTFDQIEVNKIFLNESANVFIATFNGDPNGTLLGGEGSQVNSNNGNIYRKSTPNTSNTGWIAM